MRVAFDVSVLIRLSLGSVLIAKLIRLANQGVFTVLTTDILLDEFKRTASKPRLATHLRRAVHDELIEFLGEEGEVVQLMQPFPVCRDKEDEYLLALARDGRADFLITNDQDLLSQQRIGQCEIVTPEAFSTCVGNQKPAN